MKIDFANEIIRELFNTINHSKASSNTVLFAQQLCEHIRLSEKFTLPIDGHCIDGEVTDEIFQMFHLPFPITFWQYEITPYIGDCVIHHGSGAETHKEPLKYMAAGLLVIEENDNCFNAWAFSKVMRHTGASWTIVPVGACIRDFRGIEKNSFFSIPIPMPETFIKSDRATEIVQRDIFPRLQVLLKACGMLNCENFTVEKTEPSAVRMMQARNKKRPPPYAYYDLRIVKGGSSGNRSEDAINTRRFHMRRGHIRHLRDKNIWIKPMAVGDPSKKRVKRNYRIPKGTGIVV